MTKPNPKNQKPNLLQVVSSIAAGMFGVQSQRNRQRDFSHSSPLPFILAGISFILLFVLIMVGIVTVVMKAGV
ncbi:DUF2970 domain-containing protein [Aliidiomarina quisquiliarum]|uniref:DUF2970 domain-containing protein n=1 Tax=Aliidiomarina quisquiliarum TaxID=2938947 RepID=UPI00208E24A1|nr:DUF2970 domain-containing protein [Aliidiomarina quisquiliarum]